LASSKAAPARFRCGGAVLLEVVLALVLFVAAATVITSGLSASVREVEGLRLEAHAKDLAVTVLSEMQLGIRQVEAAGPAAFDAPFDKWTCQTTVGATAAGPGDAATVQKVEVIIRHQTESTVCRMTQYLPAGAASGSTNGGAAGLTF
jgi:type II secretory pathway pseudopilin PulG